MLDIYAGKNALNVINEQGFKRELFTSFLGASGGPKWFSLFGLDKYLFGEFFSDKTQSLNLIGSSAGAFRAACFAQDDPVAAIERLATYYCETVYSEKPTPEEITQAAKDLLDNVFGESGALQIINNTHFKAHFITAKSTGLTAFDNKLLQLTGLIAGYAKNRINRKFLAKSFHRVIFQQESSHIALDDNYQFPTLHIPLTKENINDALLASGSIPLIMQGIKNIAGAPRGMYRDGGIIDYHFDFKVQPEEGLILYPHFNSTPKAGWFDKNLKRGVNPQNYDNVVMLVPSDKFIADLPFGKIPDREDFTTFKAEERMAYWRKVFVETEKLAGHFDVFVNKQQIMKIKKFM